MEISGGEPTIHPDFLTICNYARQSHSGKILVFSNGCRFNNLSFAQEFAKTGVDCVVITLHSHRAEVHDFITQHKGSFSQTLKGLYNLHSLNVALSIKFIALKANFKDAPNWASLVSKEFPGQRLMLNGLALWGDAHKNAKGLAILHSSVAPYIQEAVDIAVSGGAFPGIFFMPPCVFDPAYWNNFGVRYYHESVLEPGDQPVGSPLFEECYTFPSICSECVMKPRCVWAWKPYNMIFGLDEIHPYLC